MGVLQEASVRNYLRHAVARQHPMRPLHCFAELPPLCRISRTLACCHDELLSRDVVPIAGYWRARTDVAILSRGWRCKVMSNPATMNVELDEQVRRYLVTGHHDPSLMGWPGSDFVDASVQASVRLRDALVNEVLAKASSRRRGPRLDTTRIRDLTRSKVTPMVTGLFPKAEHDQVLATVERSVVFLTPENIERVLRSERWLHTIWSLANLYLVSVRSEPLSEDAPVIVGLSQGTTCYVSMAYFKETDPCADFIVHEVALIFHNCKRATIGLPVSRRREWLLDIDFRKRELFAYACEAFSCILAAGLYA